MFFSINKLLLAAFAFSTSFAFSMGSKPPANSEQGRWEKMVRDNGGKVVNPSNYSNSGNGFRDFMRDSKVTRFSALEIIEPYNKSAARACGLTQLLPSQSPCLINSALALWAQKIASVAGATPYIRNWYRPTCYNSRVGGASSSDHITARAIDMDFPSQSSRRKAQNWLCSFWKSSLNMQIGLGGDSIHLGAESPHGKRNWYYASYGDSDKGRTCFDN